jgi:hypothetical protein
MAANKSDIESRITKSIIGGMKILPQQYYRALNDIQKANISYSDVKAMCNKAVVAKAAAEAEAEAAKAAVAKAAAEAAVAAKKAKRDTEKERLLEYIAVLKLNPRAKTGVKSLNKKLQEAGFSNVTETYLRDLLKSHKTRTS